MDERPNPLSTRCPTCGASPGARCQLIGEISRQQAQLEGLDIDRAPHAARHRRAAIRAQMSLIRPA